MKTKTTTRLTAFALAFALLLTSCGGGGTSAATMHLRKTEGTVGVSDGEGKDVDPKDNLGLYSGYQVGTQAESYAWIDLDEVKLTKMDADSEIEVVKDGKKLEIDVKTGSLFFNITEPLADDETLDIRTSSMLVGIRGTCGWVEVPGDDTMKVFLLEGKVRCEVDSEHETIRAGEMAVMTAEGDITVSAFTAGDIPAFVMEEIEDDDDLMEEVQDDSGIDPTETDPMAAYEDVLSRIGGDRLVKEFVDFEGDGSPELLLITGDGTGKPSFGLHVFRKEPDGVKRLMGYGISGDAVSNYNPSGTLSLVESNGHLFVRSYAHSHTIGSSDYFSDCYMGSVAAADGGEKDWGTADYLMISYYIGGRLDGQFSRVEIHSHGENGLIALLSESEVGTDAEYEYYGDDISELEAVQGKYTLVRDLVIYDGTNVTVVEP